MNLNKIYDFFLSQSGNKGNQKALLGEILDLYTFIYAKAGEAAVRYGNGTHPKHRLTKYHSFFVDNVDENNSVLDLGSGRGDVTYDVAKKTHNEVVGIELNHHNLKYAVESYRLDNLKFIYGNIYNDIPSRHFDVVILSNILEHLNNRKELIKSIVSRVSPLKILLRVPCFEREWTVALKKELGLNYFLDSTHQIEYTQDEFCEEMKASGLDIVSIRCNWGEIWSVCCPKNNHEK